jgi:hypothetical protein
MTILVLNICYDQLHAASVSYKKNSPFRRMNSCISSFSIGGAHADHVCLLIK